MGTADARRSCSRLEEPRRPQGGLRSGQGAAATAPCSCGTKSCDRMSRNASTPAATLITAATSRISFSAVVKLPLTTSASCGRACGGVSANSRLAPPLRRAAEISPLRSAERGAPREIGDRGHQPVAEQRPQQGDPGGDPDLAERRVDARGHAGPLRADDADRRRGQRRIDHADPDAGDDEPRR